MDPLPNHDPHAPIKRPRGMRLLALPGMGMIGVLLIGAFLFWLIGFVSDRTVEKFLFRFESSTGGQTAHLLYRAADADASIVNHEPTYAEVTVWRRRTGLGIRSRYSGNKAVFVPHSINADVRYQIWDPRGASMVPEPDYSGTGLDPETLALLRSLPGGTPPQEQQDLYDAIAAYFDSINEHELARATRTHEAKYRETRLLGWVSTIFAISLFFVVPAAWGRITSNRRAKRHGLSFPNRSTREP